MATVALEAITGSGRVFSEHELLAGCEKLISIRDEVLGKTVSTVNQLKQSANSANIQSAAGAPPAQSTLSTHPPNGISKSIPANHTTTLQLSDVNVTKPPPNTFQTTSTSFPSQKELASAPGTSSIDPIFLTKSNVLVRAEIHQKRQRLEKALEEQILKSQRLKAMEQETLPNFDVTDVLRKAHDLVKPLKAFENRPTNGVASPSGSSDEQTFYSSQMDESMTTEELDESQKRRSRPPCRFYLRGQRCPYGDACTFSHDPALKRKSEVEPLRAADMYKSNTDGQTSSRQEVLPNKPLREDPHPEPPFTEKSDKAFGFQSQAEKENQEHIAKLEAELRSARAEHDALIHAPSRRLGKEFNNIQEEPAYSPPGPDEFGRDNGLRAPGLLQSQTVAHQSTSVDQQPIDRENGTRNGNLPSPPPNSVRVVTNNIRSPVAPQPSRVSPLAVAKVPQVSQLQRDYGEMSHMPHKPNQEISSTGPGPRTASQPHTSRKRRRGRDSGDHTRNVVPRTDLRSPVVRVKEEPTSPPLFDVAKAVAPKPWPRQQVSKDAYVETAAPQYSTERPTYYQPRILERQYYGELDEDREPRTPLIRRVLSRNSQHYIASNEPELRRVVTAPRQVRAPMSPAPSNVQYSAPQPRATRASSQVFLSPNGQNAPHSYQRSVQPQHSELIARNHQSPSPAVGQTLQSPVERRPINMAPPSKPIVVDRWGNRLVETQHPIGRHASIVPRAHAGELDTQYEPVVPRAANPARHPELVQLDGSHYVRRPLSPVSKHFYEVPARRIIGPMVNDAYQESHYVARNHVPSATYSSEVRPMSHYEEAPEVDARIVRMHSVRPTEYQLDDVPDTDGRIIRMQSARPTGAPYEGPPEQFIRVQSVRPEQPRIINLGERVDPNRQIVRPGSVFRDDGNSGQVRYAVEGQPGYDYASHRRYIE